MDLLQAKQVYVWKIKNEERKAKGLPTLRLLSYTHSRSPVTIECSEHGVQTCPNFTASYRYKYPCAECSRENRRIKSSKFMDDEYVEMFTEIHKGRYTYDMDRDEKSRVGVICDKHGEFRHTPTLILKRGYGCPHCQKVDKDSGI